MTNLKQQLANTFLDFFNNYLTVDKFAEHNEMTVEQAKIVLALGREIHEAQFS